MDYILCGKIFRYEGELVTHGSLYKFIMLNHPEISLFAPEALLQLQRLNIRVSCLKTLEHKKLVMLGLSLHLQIGKRSGAETFTGQM